MNKKDNKYNIKVKDHLLSKTKAKTVSLLFNLSKCKYLFLIMEPKKAIVILKRKSIFFIHIKSKFQLYMASDLLTYII